MTVAGQAYSDDVRLCVGQNITIIWNVMLKAAFNKEAPKVDSAFLHQIPNSIFNLSPYFLQL